MISIYFIFRKWHQWKPVMPICKIIFLKRKTVFAFYLLGLGFAIVRVDIEHTLIMLNHKLTHMK